MPVGRVLLAILALLAAPAGASALPPDPPVTPLTPADGATVPVNADGIPVTYSCPVYKIDEPGGFALFGGPKDYSVGLSKSAQTGADGRLATMEAIVHANFTDPAVGPDGCSAALGAGGPAPRVQETPGTYFWQVWRLCTGCATSYEVGPVRKLTLASPVQPKLSLPRKAYAGYGFFATADVTGAPDGTEVVVERKAGSRFKPAGAGIALGGKAEIVVVAPRGKPALRASLTIGSQAISGEAKSLTVAAAKRWTTSGRSDGAYAGKSVKLKIARGGREVRDFRAFVPMTCPGVTPGTFTTQVGTAAVKKAKVAPDGSFVAALTDDGTAIRIRGRLKGRQVSGGRAELSVGACTGSLNFKARR